MHWQFFISKTGIHFAYLCNAHGEIQKEMSCSDDRLNVKTTSNCPNVKNVPKSFVSTDYETFEQAWVEAFIKSVNTMYTTVVAEMLKNTQPWVKINQ